MGWATESLFREEEPDAESGVSWYDYRYGDARSQLPNLVRAEQCLR